MPSAIELAERGLLPDGLIRAGIRRLNRSRLKRETRSSHEAQLSAKMQLVRTMREAPVALATLQANQQHYELPVELFQTVLGPRLKYSACYWPADDCDLDQAEQLALEQISRRAELADGQRILELGCGWGALTLHMAERLPNAQIVAVSNSHTQRRFIENCARQRQLSNLTVQTVDMTDFDTVATFDRVVSVEMLEHMRNWAQLLERISRWLIPGGKCFIHIFSHRSLPYIFEPEESDNWIARYFFTAGLMPSDDLMLYFQDDLHVEDHWWLNGSHYQKTANAWLANLDANAQALEPVFERTYGPREADRWLQRWRIFFMACAELWGYDGGDQWGISHYRLSRK
jgi:cyclopropane-fatty-acyl-phospholipid synthase